MHPKNAISNFSSVPEIGTLQPLKTRTAKVIQATTLAGKDN